ncbi:MAG: hypothetical protein ACI8PZ_006131 [Myxococcota bacterium]|jgi:hypothetical protein
MREQPSTPDPRIARDIEAYRSGELPPELYSTLLEGVLVGTVDQPPTPRQRLAELPSRVRVAGALVVMGLVGAGGTLGRVRGDLDGTAALALMAGFLLLTALAVVCVDLALRSMHRPTSDSRWRAIVLGGLLIPLTASVLPIWPGVDSRGESWLQAVAGCGAPGLLASVVAAAGVLLLQRDASPVLWRVASAGAAGGIVGFIARVASCPAADLGHMVVAHGSFGLVTAALCVGAVRLRRGALS